MTSTSRPRVDLQDWVQSVRFSGDGQTVSVGGFFRHMMWNFATGGLAQRWTNNNVADPYYSVGPDFDMSITATGHGFEDTTTLVNAGGGEVWRTTEHGIQTRIAMSDAGDCYVSTNGINNAGDYVGWFMYQWDGNQGNLVWRYQVPVSLTFDTFVDAGVSRNDRVVLGGIDQTVYKWGDVGANACAPSSVPATFTMDPHLTITDVASTYDAEYSVVGAAYGQLAANHPNLYVFHTGGPGLGIVWMWLLF